MDSAFFAARHGQRDGGSSLNATSSAGRVRFDTPILTLSRRLPALWMHLVQLHSFRNQPWLVFDASTDGGRRAGKMARDMPLPYLFLCELFPGRLAG